MNLSARRREGDAYHTGTARYPNNVICLCHGEQACVACVALVASAEFGEWESVCPVGQCCVRPSVRTCGHCRLGPAVVVGNLKTVCKLSCKVISDKTVLCGWTSC